MPAPPSKLRGGVVTDSAEAQRIAGFIETRDAQVVHEEQYGGDIQHGPALFTRVGFRIGEQVFWTGSAYYPHDDGHAFRKGEALAEEIVRRWKAGRQ